MAFGILEGESNDLLNANYDIKDAFGDRLVVFDGESKMKWKNVL